MRRRSERRTLGRMLVVSFAVAASVALLVAMLLYAPEYTEPDDDKR